MYELKAVRPFTSHFSSSVRFLYAYDILLFSTSAQVVLFGACKVCAKNYKRIKTVCAKVTSVRYKCAKNESVS